MPTNPDNIPDLPLTPDLQTDLSVQEVLSNLEDICRDIVDQVPDIIYRLDGAGNIVFISEAIRKYGYDPATLVGRSIFDLVHPQDRDRARFRVNERRTGDRSTKSLQVRLLTTDDAAIPFELRDSAAELPAPPDGQFLEGEVSPRATELLVDAQGVYDGDEIRSEAFLFTQGVARDISERFRVEASMAASRARFEERLDSYAVQLRDAYDRLQEKATRQDREAQQRQVLQQMRDAIWCMDEADSIGQLLRILHEGLARLHVEHHGLAINHCGQATQAARDSYFFFCRGGDLERAISDDPGHIDIIRQVVRRGTPLYRPDLELSDDLGERDRIRTAWQGLVRSVLDVPFNAGTLALNSLTPDAFSEDLQTFLGEVATVIGEGYRRAADLVALSERRLEAETSAREREHAVERLEHSQESYRGLVEDLPVGIAHTTPDGRVLYSNPQVRRMFGYDDEEWSALRLEALYENATDLSDLALALRRDGVTTFEVPMCRKDGQRMWVRGTSRLVLNPVTAQEEVHGVLEDVTLRRQMEDEYRRLEDQLRQAQRMEAVGQLTAGISHNFNNMLQGISGNLQLALLDAPEELQTMLRDADRVTHRAAEMVQQLIVFSRQGSRGDIHRQRLQPILVSALEICRRTFDRRISLTDDLEPDLDVLGDMALLQQAIVNLLINARDAVDDLADPGRSPTIHLQARAHRVTSDSAEPPGSPGVYACIEITDNGIGMDANTQRRIYEPFFSTKPVDRGTGLGLATVYGIVSQHAGWLECDSQPGQGTTFRLFLPSQEAPPTPQTPKLADASDRTTQGTLLIIDDEDLVRDSTARLLERSGYRVLTAASGERGLKIFESCMGDIDLVLLDLSMPTMSGHEVLLRMRELDPDVHVLILTGYAIGDVDFDAAVLRKPFTIAELKSRVSEVLH